MKQKLHHESEGSTSYRFIRLKVLLFVFSITLGEGLEKGERLPQKWAVRQSPHVLKTPPQVPTAPTPSESPAEKVDPRQWCQRTVGGGPMKGLCITCCRDLGTAGDVVVVLFRVGQSSNPA